MKKYILSVLVCVLGLSHLQADNISVANVTIEPGQSATVAISLENTETNLVSFQMDLTLPTGISINKSGCSLSSRFTDEDQGLTIGKQGTNVYRLTSTSFALIPITGTSGEIITLTLTASDNSEGGTATLSNIRFVTSESGKVLVSDASFSITVATPSPAITFADSNVKELCVANWDTDDDGELSVAEAAAVTELGEVFRGNTEITSFDEISYFTGLTGFDDDAFNGCSGLTSFTIPSNITSIGRRAFQNCSSLASITIPESVTDIYYHAFSYCTGITSITVDPGNGVYDSRYDCNAIIKTSANQLVAGCKNTIIPDNVTRIGNYAFLGCSDLTSITIPESVTAIGNSAFYGCSNLASIEIPNSVTSIESAAFRKCSSLTTVTVDMDTPLEIDNLVFATPANATLFVPIGSKTAYETADNWKEFGTIVEYGNITFADSNVKELCVANWDTDDDGELSVAEAAAVTELGEVFKGNTEITSFDELAYFTGMTTISADAFSGCTSLTSVKLPSTVTSIGHGAFWSCGQLASIDFNGCKASIKYDAFGYCTSLVNVTLPSGTYPDGYSCFYGCTSLESFVMEASDNLPDKWPEGTFAMCTNLETVVVYGKVLRGPNNFRKCTSLQTVTYLDSTPGTNYNQNFRGAASGIQFIIPEGSAETFLRQGYVNMSDKSALPIAREEFEDEVARIEAMATAAGSDATALSQAISEARTIVNNATDYPTVFAQIAAVKEAAREFLATATLADEFDVTAAYVTNPDITRFDIGWQTSSGWMTAGYQTASYTNGDVSIDHFVEMQKGDGALPDGEISQTISQLPAGIYRLEADIIATNLNDADVTGVSLYAGSKKTSVFTENEKPQHFALTFENAITQNVNIGISCLSTNANWVAMDNVRLYYVDSAETLFASASSEHPVDVTSFIINPSFVDNNADGWEGSEPQFQSYNNAEFYQTTFDIHQTISGLPNGNYLLKVKGFHRPGQNQDVFTSYNEGTNNARAELYANAESKTLVNQAQYAQDSQAYGGSDVTYNNETSYVPNSMQEARRWFDAGYYENELPVTVNDGTLTIGIRLDESVGYGWVIFDDFQLAFLGQEQQSNVPFADTNVKEICVANWDTDDDGELSEAEAAAVAELGEVFKGNTEITSFDELQYFTGLTIIGNDAFRDCSGLTSVTIPNSVTSIGGWSFAGCSSLASIVIPANVTNIYGNSFGGCAAMEQMSVDPSNSVYDSRNGCNAIIETSTDKLVAGCQTTQIPDGIETIGSCAFDGRWEMQKMAIPETVTTIEDYAFVWCISLSSITLPASVSVIGNGAFNSCENLTSIQCKMETPPSIAEDVFTNRTNATLFVPVGSKAAYQAADYWKEFGAIFEGDLPQENVELTDVSAIDNVIYMEPIEATKGGEVTVPILMKNTTPIRGFQFDMYLPDGVTVKINSYNRLDCSLSSDRLPSGSAHTLTVSEQQDGAIRFLCGSQYDETFTGTDGKILTVRLCLDEHLLDGQYPIVLKNVKLTETTINNYYLTETVQTALNVIPYIPGDISGDGVIDVSDYIGVANYILGTSQEGITAAAADVNKDKLVDVSDYIGIANMILYNNIYGQTVSAARSAERRRVNTDVSTLDNIIYISPFEAASNGETQVSIRMKNTVGIRGFQFDLYLPDGMTAVKDGNNRYVSTLSSGRKPAGDQHTLTLSEQPDGAIRFLCGSQYDETFTGTDGEIATLTISIDAAVEAEDYPIYLRNMKLTETDINNFYTTNEIETSVTVTGPADGRVVLRETATSLPVVDETEEVDVVVYRTLKAGEWSTICLPFDMDEDQMKEFFGDEVQLAKFDKYTSTKTGSDVTGITISFTAVDLADDGFEANVPYIIKPSKTEDITSFELTTMIAPDDVKAGSNKKGWFYGTYEAETVVPENSLFLNGNKFYYSTGKTKMKAFRAYFTLPVVLADVSNASSRIALSFEETTDVKELKSSRIEGLKSYYNLKGQRVEAPVKKGLYIRDGKKVVIK